MAKKSHGLAARVTALEKTIAEMFSGKKAKTKKVKKARTTKTTTQKAKPKSPGKTKGNIAKSRIAPPATARSRKNPEHGIFPDSPPIFAVDEADAEAAIGIKRDDVTVRTSTTHKKDVSGARKREKKISRPGMMGDGTEEQSLGQRGNSRARIKKDEVEAAFGRKAP
jgi:hypothetical protein